MEKKYFSLYHFYFYDDEHQPAYLVIGLAHAQPAAAPDAMRTLCLGTPFPAIYEDEERC